jgi:hypothetical protein
MQAQPLLLRHKVSLLVPCLTCITNAVLSNAPRAQLSNEQLKELQSFQLFFLCDPKVACGQSCISIDRESLEGELPEPVMTLLVIC